jgi:predicted lipoprotein
MYKAGGWSAGLLVVAVLAVGCKKEAEEEEVVVDVSGPISDFWPLVLEPALIEAGDAAELLRIAGREWSEAAQIVGAATEITQGDAQDAFVDAVLAWEKVELMQVGPLGPSYAAIGGLDMRDHIYSWPFVSGCRVDEETVEANWGSVGFYDDNLTDVFGYDALEHVLYDDLENDCGADADINQEGDWEDLGPDGVVQNRAAFAESMAARIKGDIDDVYAAWSPDDGNFAGALQYAGEVSSPFVTPIEALNAIFDALFYLDTVVEDKKVGWHAGEACSAGDACAGELPLSGLSALAVQKNLEAGRDVFTGATGRGFDDVLEDIGEGALSAEVLAQFDDAAAAAGAIADPYGSASPDDIEALHASLRALNETLRVDVAAALALQVPEGAG